MSREEIFKNLMLAIIKDLGIGGSAGLQLGIEIAINHPEWAVALYNAYQEFMPITEEVRAETFSLCLELFPIHEYDSLH